MGDRGFRVPESLRYIFTQQVTQRRQQFRQSLRRRRHNWVPVQEVAEHRGETFGVPLLYRARAFVGNVAREPDGLFPLAVPVENPFVPVRVNEVRECLELVELFPVVALEVPNGDLGSLQFDVSTEGAANVQGYVRSSDAGNRGLEAWDHVKGELRSKRAKKVPGRAF